MRLDKQTCDWHNKKCNSLCVTQDISKGACQAAGNSVALIRVKINPVATNSVASRIFHIPADLVVACVTAHRKPPDVRICRLRNQSAVGTCPPSTSTPH